MIKLTMCLAILVKSMHFTAWYCIMNVLHATIKWTTSHTMKSKSFKNLHLNSYTVFSQIVSVETILFWIFKTLKISYSFRIKFLLCNEDFNSFLTSMRKMPTEFFRNVSRILTRKAAERKKNDKHKKTDFVDFCLYILPNNIK